MSCLLYQADADICKAGILYPCCQLTIVVQGEGEMKEPGRVYGEIFFYDHVREVEGRIVLQAVPGVEQ